VDYSKQLIASAQKLLASDGGTGPSAADCNRAVSTAYYAFFDFLCSRISCQLIGNDPTVAYTQDNWVKVYRSLNHRQIRLALFEAGKTGADPLLLLPQMAVSFKKLQEEREDADYNFKRVFSATEAAQLVNEAKLIIELAEMTFDFSHESIAAIIVALFVKKQNLS
jgi:hypothetical protein